MGQLRSVIFEEAQDVDACTVVLQSLTFHTEILEVVFERKYLERRIERVIAGETPGAAVGSLIQELQMAAVVPILFIPIIMNGAERVPRSGSIDRPFDLLVNATLNPRHALRCTHWFPC